MQNNAPNSISSESPERKHEARPPHLRNVVISIGAIVSMIFFSLIVVGILIHFWSHKRPMQSMQSLGVVSAPNLKPLARFPSPNLEIDDDHAQRVALLAAQNEKLNSYGWIDCSNGIVRIPIERAMNLILERGLPTRTNAISQTDISPLQLIQERPEQR